MYKQLYEYQRRAVNFIIKHPYCGICIAPDMGKESIGLEVVWQQRYNYFLCKKVLIVVERDLEERWKQELNDDIQYKRMSFVSVKGNNEEKKKIMKLEKDIYFADDNTLVWITEQEESFFDTVIIDDLSRFNHHKTKSFRQLYQHRFGVDRLIGFLPESHKLEDLWAEWLLIDGGRSLGMYKDAFLERYFFREKHKWEAKSDARKSIYGLLSNTMYWVDNRDESELPENLYKNLYIELDAGEYSKYQWFESGNACCFDLMQLANGMWCDGFGKGYCLHIRKIKELINICKLHQNNKILVLYWFLQDALLIRDNIKNAALLQSYEDVMLWRNTRIQLGVVSALDAKKLKVLGYSADVLVWFSLNESKDIYKELNGTMLKVGSRTWVYHLIVKGTIDEEMAGCYIG